MCTLRAGRANRALANSKLQIQDSRLKDSKQNGRPQRADGRKEEREEQLPGFCYVGCLRALVPLNDFEFNAITFLERLIAVGGDGRIVHEHIGAVVPADKSVPFRVIKPFHLTSHFQLSLPPSDPEVEPLRAPVPAARRESIKRPKGVNKKSSGRSLQDHPPEPVDQDAVINQHNHCADGESWPGDAQAGNFLAPMAHAG